MIREHPHGKLIDRNAIHKRLVDNSHPFYYHELNLESTIMKPGRNDPCPCGSGKKYKHCCEAKTGPMSRHKSLVLVAAVLVIAGGAWMGRALFTSDAGQGSFSQQPGPAPAGKVWSAEHGHWHDAAPGRSQAGSGQASFPQPPGPVPAGKVWSAEHGHWHDVPPGQSLADSGQTDTP